MNYDEIKDMPAGRELDRLVAEKVMMGWRWYPARCRVCGGPLFREVEQGCTTESCSLHPAPKVPAAESYPAYSTSIAEAFAAVGKVHEMFGLGGRLVRDTRLSFLTLAFTGLTTGYAASFDTDLTGEWWEHAERYLATAVGATAPLAICRAALLAVGSGR